MNEENTRPSLQNKANQKLGNGMSHKDIILIKFAWSRPGCVRAGSCPDREISFFEDKTFKEFQNYVLRRFVGVPFKFDFALYSM